MHKYAKKLYAIDYKEYFLIKGMGPILPTTARLYTLTFIGKRVRLY